ncbi:threonine--tRNA ligase [Verticiella sediminum]|uniref:Threonine--tRNA ligase n=1 Tax=Verticiella sediminum TaxID=1247510 RepID=A0A556AWY4_9BURK|nr:threonine--tRNA ligase [Verticiella sediminum]TSH97458.1 threonine--tRNA ligase [Verticiella sediminum]
MVQISLPDGSRREFPQPVSVAEVAQSIGAGLARAALAGRVRIGDGEPKLVDTSYRIERDAELAIVTAKEADGLDLIRHSTAHLLAYAVKELFPGAQVTIGPVIENGFYYDFSYSRPFTPEDLAAIEKKMGELVKKDIPVSREEWKRDDAVAFFHSIGEKYKAQIIASIPSNETISLYREGDFIDLCRGPHVPSTGKLKVFKLMKVAGAYWRGDSKNEMLQRIYGTAWATKEEQDAYLHMLEEAEKRDHRKLGRELDLFHFQEEAPGLIFWHPKGWTLWQQVEQYMRAVYRDNGYQEVKAPQILDRSLWEKTGHWENYRENMFTTESENRYYALKPMNCPGHVQIFNSALRSYRDLPLRYGEFGQCHRNEPSGALHGMMRVRGFTQDDGHIFCTEDQILDECVAFTSLLQRVYADFGFTEVLYKVATRPQKRIGSDEIWDKAENALMESLRRSGVEFEVAPGDGAFYGPKIEYTLKDAIGRHWQCGTIQVDFSMPNRLGAEFVDANDQRITPVMLHRAILGSFERFIGMLIENHAGAMPPWLAPAQAVVCSISEGTADYAADVAGQLRQSGMRVESDLRGEKITYKIREHSLQKVPYILVVGEKEKQAGAVAVRGRGGLDLGVMPLADFAARLTTEVATRRDNPPPPAITEVQGARKGS